MFVLRESDGKGNIPLKRLVATFNYVYACASACRDVHMGADAFRGRQTP